MPEYTHKENNGSAFKNDKKEADWHSDYKGTINVAGTLHFLDVYENTTKAGAKYFGVRIGKALDKQEPSDYAKPAENPVDKPADDIDDDIPF